MTASSLLDRLNRDGFVVIPSILTEDQLKDLRSATRNATELARAGKWPNVRTLPKQFPPWPVATPEAPPDGIWGVQGMMHPDMPNNAAFIKTYFSDAVIEPTKQLLQCSDDDLVMELFNLLIRPDEDFELRWHRDDIPATATAEEELDRLNKPAYSAQWNLALYDDNSLIVVPGSHTRARTDIERNADPYEKEIPEQLYVELKAGDIVFYNNNILHRGAYVANKERMTLHGSAGHVNGSTLRARNVLQHGLKGWVDKVDLGVLDEKERARAENMRRMLVKLGQEAGEVWGRSASGLCTIGCLSNKVSVEPPSCGQIRVCQPSTDSVGNICVSLNHLQNHPSSSSNPSRSKTPKGLHPATMLPSSVRRVVASAPQSPLVASLTTSAPRAATATITLQQRPVGGHQRRWSSSSPSNPNNNGSKDIPAQGQSVHASTSSSSSSSGKANGEKRKRKSKDSADREAAQKLPSVPSTQHLSQEALGLSTFFSLHRPISVTHSMPKSVTEEAFAAIFKPRSRANKVTDVISTLSRTTDDLEGAMAKMTIGHQETDASGEPVQKIDFKNPDGTESSVYVQLNSMAGQFVPFRPPPAPEAMGETAADAATSHAATAAESAVEDLLDETPHHRVYKAMFTIEETTDADGQVQVLAHSPKIMQDGGDAPRSFLERMALRQMKFDEAQGHDTMHALSVKRQRKLKMKKKKYKKLMKRTRNLRRKLDRI
ncbi:phytanoyl-CoA dioxygenase [Colletotrichum scovillei]|uniref:Phytanoyl-CoA dioxygenase n=2 Tax=Colletotrichum scovillei TaxID=1209932 RepID=A0A9P7R1C9_9PEZI|nr:phytanoyl-CoA dioxygenase [Colletotrichum scovillei]KAG7049705.1 phytanoyl-CoA dioxygenase [Colletotrichum scovillei]KAG7064444.1 phytanoyl-CoA dioxygenase [Colletotrichum scovillei]